MHLPPELIVFIISMIPILGRAAIPIGSLLKLPLEASFFWAITGNMLAVAMVLKLLGPVSDFLMTHSKIFNKFFNKIFYKTRKKHSKKLEEIGEVLLISIVSIPIPGAGSWTGVLVAFLFDLPYFKSLLLIFLGLVVSNIILSLGVTTVEHIPGILSLFIGQGTP